MRSWRALYCRLVLNSEPSEGLETVTVFNLLFSKRRAVLYIDYAWIAWIEGDCSILITNAYLCVHECINQSKKWIYAACFRSTLTHYYLCGHRCWMRAWRIVIPIWLPSRNKLSVTKCVLNEAVEQQRGWTLIDLAIATRDTRLPKYRDFQCQDKPLFNWLREIDRIFKPQHSHSGTVY